MYKRHQCKGGMMYMSQDVQEAGCTGGISEHCTGGRMFMRQDVHEVGCS
jgi:hypothetical protein